MKLSRIAQVIGAVVPEGVDDVEISGINSPESADESEITFLSNAKYTVACETGRSKFVIVKNGVSLLGKTCLEVKDPYLGYALTAQLFEELAPLFGNGIHSTAFVDSSAKIDPSVSIGPGSVIGALVLIGKDTQIDAGCIIEKKTTIGESCRINSRAVIRWNSQIGNRVIIQSGSVIGSDGFGNAKDGPAYIRIPAFGNVVIEDDVNIGANTTIDRGNFEPTVIGKGVKIDNLVQIAHNVTVGEHTAIAAQVGVSGSTHIGMRAILAGQAGFVGHIEIGDDAFIGAQAGVSKSVLPGAKVTGYPARDFMTMRRIEAAQQSLPAVLKEIKKIKGDLDQLKCLGSTSES